MKKLLLAALAVGTFAASAMSCGQTVIASSGSGTTTTVLGQRATLANSVQINDERIKFQTKDPTDVLVQTITFKPGGFSGWHYHPGVVIVVVQSGAVTTHNSSCQTQTYAAHETFVESGNEPFMVSNQGSVDAVVYVTIIVPKGDPFRIESSPPACA